MNFFKKAKNALYNVAQKAIGAVGSITNSLSITFGRGDKDKIDLFSGWVYRAVDTIAKTIAGTEFKVLEFNDGDSTRVDDHRILNLLRSPNDQMHGWQFWYTLVAQLLLTGDAYILMPNVNSKNDEPSEMFLLSSGRVSTEITEGVPARIKNYEVNKLNGVGTQTIDKEKIIHLTLPNPRNQFEGYSPIDAIEEWILEDHHASRYNLAFFKNGAKLSGVIESDTKLTETQQKTMKKTFENLHSGTENAYQVATLPKGKKYKEMSSSREEMDFIEGQKLTMDKILAGFQVPKTLVGAQEDQTNRSTAETAEYVFAKYNISPFLVMIVNALNFTLVTRFEDSIALAFEDPVPDDKEHKIEELKAATGDKQVMTLNEARERYFDLGGLEGGDVIRDKVNQTEVAEDTGKDVPEYARKAMSYQQRKKPATEKCAEKAAKEITKIFKQNGKNKIKRVKNIAEMDDEEFEKLAQAFDDRMAGFESNLIENFKQYHKAQKETVLSNLEEELKEKNIETKQIERNDLFDFKEQVGIMFDFVKPLFVDLVETEAEETADLIATEVNVDEESFQELADEAAVLLSQSYNETTSKKIISKVNEGIEQGEDFEGIADRVDEVYQVADRQRAVTTARTETVRLGNASARQTYEESGFVETLKWYTAVDDRVCEFCRPLHNTIVDIDESFFGSDVEEIEGDEGGKLPLNYEETKDHPPLHPRCRCYIRPDELDL
jgi:HK97 family phage portal protein